jgi:cell volume regulation protein A
MPASQSLQLILGLGAMLLAGAGLAILAERWHVPDIVLFLLLGIALGPSLLDVVRPAAMPSLAEGAVMLGAAYLLFEGGRSLDAKELRAGWRGTVILATLGVLVTTVVVAGMAHLALGLNLSQSLLIGAVLAPTDPAAIVPILAALPVAQRLKALLVSESAANDATGAALAVVLAGGLSIGSGLLTLAWNLALGLAVGGIIGLLLHELEGRLRAPHQSLRTLLALAALITAYTAATLISASGFLAAFIAGLIAGRSHRRLRRQDPVAASFYEYSAGIFGRLVRLTVFSLLGASLVPSVLWRLALPALLVTLTLVVVARPLTVMLLPLDRRGRYRWSELAFAAWVRETGVVPGALAALLLAQNAPLAPEVAACVFAAVIVTLLVQAPTTQFLARRLGLLH